MNLKKALRNLFSVKSSKTISFNTPEEILLLKRFSRLENLVNSNLLTLALDYSREGQKHTFSVIIMSPGQSLEDVLLGDIRLDLETIRRTFPNIVMLRHLLEDAS